jgi:hypothetical protein
MSESQKIPVISVFETVPEFPTIDEVVSCFNEILHSSSRNTRSSNIGAIELNNGVCFVCGEKAYLNKNYLPGPSHKCSDISRK